MDKPHHYNYTTQDIKMQAKFSHLTLLNNFEIFFIIFLKKA